jgi:ribosomal protein S18 acetylase RimI-like enzyme
MNLNEEIKRIKGLIYENVNEPFIISRGDINKSPGINFTIKDGETSMGHVNITTFDDAYENDSDVVSFTTNMDKYCNENCDENFFNNRNTAYLHDLKVYDEYRGKGLSNKLLDKCHETGKELGVDYILLITNCDNTVAQNLYRKHGYKVHSTNGSKDYFYKPIK